MVLHETKTSNKPKLTKYLNITIQAQSQRKHFRQLKFLHTWNISVANLHDLPSPLPLTLTREKVMNKKVDEHTAGHSRSSSAKKRPALYTPNLRWLFEIQFLPHIPPLKAQIMITFQLKTLKIVLSVYQFFI